MKVVARECAWSVCGAHVKVVWDHQWLVMLIKVRWNAVLTGEIIDIFFLILNSVSSCLISLRQRFNYPWWCSKSFFSIISTPKPRASFDTRKALTANRETPASASIHQPTCDATKNAGTKICIVFFSCGPRPSLKKSFVYRGFRWLFWTNFLQISYFQFFFVQQYVPSKVCVTDKSRPFFFSVDFWRLTE